MNQFIDLSFDKFNQSELEKRKICLNITDIGMNTDDKHVALKCAVVLKEMSEYESAHKVFFRCDNAWPNDEHIRYEFVRFIYRSKGPISGDQIFSNFISNSDANHLLLKNFVCRVLFENDENSSIYKYSIEKYLECCDNSDNEYMRSALYFSLRNVTKFNIAKNYSQSVNAQDKNCVFEQIKNAISVRKPYCLVRIGDGEGAVFGSIRNNNNSLMNKNHLSYFCERWFSSSDEETFNKVKSVGHEILRDLRNADIIGFPQWSWVSSEINVRNMAVYMNCIEAIYGVMCSGKKEDIIYTDSSISIQMEDARLLSELVVFSGSVSIITSRTEMKGYILSNLGVNVDLEIIIPPPASDPTTIPGSLPKGSQLFNGYESTREKLKSIKKGDLVLVAAGILGKIYCLDVKQNGGIAIDIGYLADMWVNHNGRPEYNYSSNLRLS